MFVNWLKNNNVSDYSFDTRLFEKASNRAFWDGVMTDAHRKTAEEYLGYEWPLIRASQYMDFQKNGDRLSQDTPHFARRYTLLKLVVGELAEYKGRFLPDIVDGIFAICEESYWGLSAHYPPSRLGELLPCAADPYIDLFAGETAELLSVIYHIFYDELYKFCPPIIERIEYEMDRRIFKPYVNRADYWWMGYGPKKVNNWTPWILSNVLTAFVCIDVKKTERDYAITKTFKEMQTYYDTIPSDGGCDEGSHYWTVAAAKVLAYLDVLYITSGGKINLFSDKKLGEMALYELRVHIGGTRFVNFADGLASIKTTNLDYPLYGFGIRTGKPEMCALAKALKNAQIRDGSAPAVRGSKIKEVLFSIIYAKDIDAQGDFVPQKSHILPDLENAFL
ncbi:MAG: hypothetical protein IIX09_08290, partial [Clostridia bacterium]|nr:hypothetical protein [Clostridia bacterium]